MWLCTIHDESQFLGKGVKGILMWEFSVSPANFREGILLFLFRPFSFLDILNIDYIPSFKVGQYLTVSDRHLSCFLEASRRKHFRTEYIHPSILSTFLSPSFFKREKLLVFKSLSLFFILKVNFSCYAKDNSPFAHSFIQHLNAYNMLDARIMS